MEQDEQAKAAGEVIPEEGERVVKAGRLLVCATDVVETATCSDRRQPDKRSRRGRHGIITSVTECRFQERRTVLQ